MPLRTKKEDVDSSIISVISIMMYKKAHETHGLNINGGIR